MRADVGPAAAIIYYDIVYRYLSNIGIIIIVSNYVEIVNII